MASSRIPVAPRAELVDAKPVGETFILVYEPVGEKDA
jgi:hypothetical protein